MTALVNALVGSESGVLSLANGPWVPELSEHSFAAAVGGSAPVVAGGGGESGGGDGDLSTLITAPEPLPPAVSTSTPGPAQPP